MDDPFEANSITMMPPSDFGVLKITSKQITAHSTKQITLFKIKQHNTAVTVNIKGDHPLLQHRH